MVCKYVSGSETPGDAGRETLPRHIPVARRQRPKTRLRCGQEQQQNETVSNSSHYPVRAPETVAAEANAQTNANRGWAGNLGQQCSKPTIGETLSSMKNNSPPPTPGRQENQSICQGGLLQGLHFTSLLLHDTTPYRTPCYTIRCCRYILTCRTVYYATPHYTLHYVHCTMLCYIDYSHYTKLSYNMLTTHHNTILYYNKKNRSDGEPGGCRTFGRAHV
jgi:hypothetical protein